jgi:hypothetical protein
MHQRAGGICHRVGVGGCLPQGRNPKNSDDHVFHHAPTLVHAPERSSAYELDHLHVEGPRAQHQAPPNSLHLVALNVSVCARGCVH